MRWDPLFIAAFTFIISAAFCSADISGRWIGTYDLQGNQSSLSVSFEDTAGNAEMISEGLVNLKVSDVQLKDNSVQFRISRGDLAFLFHGKINGSSLSGEIQVGELKGTFQLLKIASIGKTERERLFGVYRFGSDRFLCVRTWDELGKDQLTAFHSDGSIYALHPKSTNVFFSGPGILIPSSPQDEFHFVGSAEGLRVEWHRNGKIETGQRLSTIQETPVSITTENQTLSGSYVIPEGKGPFPGVVLVHGSGTVTRDFFGPFAYVLASRGIAVISYDKRQDWMESSFESLASDAASALRWLRNQKNIDLKRTGLLGISQGGWLVPVAASMVPEAGFAILISAAGVSPAEQEVMRQQGEMIAAGATDEQIEPALEQLRGQLEWVRKEESASELEQEIAKLKNAGKTAELKVAGIENPQFLMWYRQMMDFNPIPVLKKTKVPVLAIYGELDRTVPAATNSILIRKALQEAGNKNVKFHTFPAGNHALLESKTGGRQEFAHQTRFVEGFFDVVSRWILSL